MNTAMQLPVIAGVEITTDDQGRFNLNALHRASGGAKKDGPAYWLALDATKDLIDALIQKNTEMSAFNLRGGNSDTEIPVSVKRGGTGQGTFVVEHLAVAYANWISPKFYLTVIQTFLDYKSGSLRPAMPQSLPEALRYAAELAEQNQAMLPKVEALGRLSEADGSLCMRDAAKTLQMRPIDLRKLLVMERWIYGRPGHNGWLAYQVRIQQGLLVHKVNSVRREDGSEKVVEQVRVTPKGLTKLAEALRERGMGGIPPGGGSG